MELLASMSFSRRLMGGRVKAHRGWWGVGVGCESFFLGNLRGLEASRVA